MAKLRLSAKHLQISKANTMVVTVVAVSAFLTTFSLVAARSLLVKRTYQGKVIAKKAEAAKQLEDNIEAVDQLTKSYNAFVDQQENIIKGSSAGQGERDGDNAKIILDALPSSYDFPALATTLDKILNSRNLTDGVISGQDDEIAQKTASSGDTVPIEIPFQLSASGSYVAMQDLIRDLDISIRPIQIVSIQLSGNEATLSLNISAKTFYQPEKQLKITKVTVE